MATQKTLQIEDEYFTKFMNYLMQFSKYEITITSYTKSDDNDNIIIDEHFEGLAIEEFIKQFPKEVNYIDTSDIATEDILQKGKYYIRDTLNAPEYKMYYSGWELDTSFWVLNDGRKFTTDHERLVEFTNEEFIEYTTDLEKYLEIIKDL